MKKNIYISICFMITAMLLTGCNSSKPSEAAISAAKVASTSEVPISDVKATKTSEMTYEKGGVPRIYITTANYANKLNSSNNIALDKKVTISSCETDELREASLVDGNPDTRWASGYSDNEYFIVDLGEVKSFSYITMKFENAYGKEYSISVSDDNSSWTPIVEEKNGSAGDKEYKLNKTSARYIKWQGIKRGTEYGYSIYEFGVYKNHKSAGSNSVAAADDYPYLSSFTEEYQPASVTIVDCEDGSCDMLSDKKATIRIRGNSTALTNKKSYNFKLSSKEDVLGLGKGKKWCLLANHFDKTMLRNKIAYDFAESLSLPVKLNSTFVEIYIDGVYEGTYLLSEPASDGKNRVDIAIDQGEFLFERCMYVDSESEGMIESPIYNLNFEFRAPNYDEVTEEQKTQLINFLGEAERAIESGDQTAIESIININSFASMYVSEELFKNVDYTFDSDYFYTKNEKLYAGPIWDKDLSMGNVSTVYEYEPYYNYHNLVIDDIQYGNGSGDCTEGTWALKGWYEVLMKYDFFKQLVADKFDQVEVAYDQLYADGGVIDCLVNQYGALFEKNYTDTYWNLTTPYCKYCCENPDDTYVANVEYLKNWLKNRKEWVYSNKALVGNNVLK